MDDRSRHGESYVLLSTSDMGLVRDFQLIITQVALRRQLSSVPSDRCAVACRSASAAAHSDSGFYGGINVTFMPFLCTPVVCENLSCADLSCPPPRPGGGGRFTLRPGNRSWSRLEFDSRLLFGPSRVLLEQLSKPNEAYVSQSVMAAPSISIFIMEQFSSGKCLIPDMLKLIENAL